MHELYINRTLIRIPGEWDELTRDQLKFISGAGSMNLSEMSLKLNLLFYIGGIQVLHVNPLTLGDDPESLYSVKLKEGKTAYVTASQLQEICAYFDFLLKKTYKDDKIVGVALDSKLTKNLIYYFTLNGKRYYGPSSRLFNVTLSEFIHAETNCSRYVKTKEMQHLDKLIAVLYRPAKNKLKTFSNKYDGDRRIAFNDHKIDSRALKFHKLERNVKLSIYLFYQGCQWWFQNKFPHVFKGSGGGGEDNKLGYLNLVDMLKAGDVTKDVYKTPMMEVLVHLERACIENEEMKEKLKKK